MPLHKSPFEKGKLIITFSVSIVSKGKPINGALQISNGCNCEYQKGDCSSKLSHRRTPLKNKPHYRLGLCYSADYYQRITLESWFTSLEQVRWKTRGVENAGCGKCGVWKMRSVENAFSISISVEMRRNSVLTIKKKRKRKKCAMNHCILRCAGLGW